MKKIICDRCGREIYERDSVCRINVYDVDSDGARINADDVINNISNYFYTKDYCVYCIEDLKDFMKKK